MKTIDIKLSTKKNRVKKTSVQILLEPEIAERIIKLGSPNVSIGKKVKAIIKHIISSDDLKLNLE